MDLELLLSTCNKITVEDVFGDSAPSQPILLALVNQLSHNLDQDLEVKSQFLLEAVQGLDLTDPVVSSALLYYTCSLNFIHYLAMTETFSYKIHRHAAQKIYFR